MNIKKPGPRSYEQSAGRAERSPQADALLHQASVVPSVTSDSAPTGAPSSESQPVVDLLPSTPRLEENDAEPSPRPRGMAADLQGVTVGGVSLPDPPEGWRLRQGDDPFNRWGISKVRSVFEKRFGSESRPFFDLSVLTDGERFIPAHGGVVMDHRVETADEAAAIAVAWYVDMVVEDVSLQAKCDGWNQAKVMGELMGWFEEFGTPDATFHRALEGVVQAARSGNPFPASLAPEHAGRNPWGLCAVPGWEATGRALSNQAMRFHQELIEAN